MNFAAFESQSAQVPLNVPEQIVILGMSFIIQKLFLVITYCTGDWASTVYRKKEGSLFPFAPEEWVSRQVIVVPSPAAPLTLHKSRSRELFFFLQTANRHGLTRLRTDDVYRTEPAVTRPVVLATVRVTRVLPTVFR